MKSMPSPLSTVGIGVGALALLLALIHFHGGPFTGQPALEEVVANKAVAIRDATVAALKGERRQTAAAGAPMDMDRVLQIATAILGGLAIILGVVGFARQEPLRAAGGAAFMGAGALAFQFLTIALGAIILAILVAAVITQLDFG